MMLRTQNKNFFLCVVIMEFVNQLTLKEVLDISRPESSTHFNLSALKTTDRPTIDPSIQDMDKLLQTERENNFLSNFSNRHQRYLISNQMKFCPMTDLCGFSFGLQPGTCCEQCHCDRETCMETRSCCPDVLPANYLDYTGMNTDTYEEMESLISKNHSVKEIPMCEPTLLTPPYRGNPGYYMMSTCPRTTEAGLRINCTRIYTKELHKFTEFLPVYSLKTLVVYRNKYCALCNNIQQEHIGFWKPMLNCTKDWPKDINSLSEILNLVFNDKECALSFQEPDVKGLHLVTCLSSVSRCNMTGKWIQYNPYVEAGCLSYRSEYKVYSNLYKNILCALCNENRIPIVEQCPHKSSTHSKFSFSGLLKLDFATISGDRGLASAHSNCSVNQKYNPLTGNCTELLCDDLSVLQNGQCTSKYEYIVGEIMYIIHLQLESTDIITVDEVYNMRHQLIELVLHAFKSWVNFMDRNDTICDLEFYVRPKATEEEEVYKLSVVHSELVIKMARLGRQIVHELADAVQKVHKTTLNLHFHNQVFTFLVSAKDTHKILSDEMIYYYRPNMKSKSAIIDMDVCVTNKCNHVTKFINALGFTSCPKVNISKTESSWRVTKGGINISGLLIKFNKYYHDGNKNIIICADSLNTPSESGQDIHDYVNIEVILSIICSSFSLLSLTIAFCTFCFFSELRLTLPGKNNLALVTTLLLSQVMFLIGSFSPIPKFSVFCKIAGMFVHYSWLAALFWMNACTYNVFKTLSQMRVVSGSSGWKTFFCYISYVLSMSAIFVVINVIIATSASGDIGYGGMYCYINSQNRIMITLGIPAAFVILSNLCMFFMVIFKIKRAPRINRNVKHERNDLLIFVKLSTITGFTWIFGLLHAWTDILVFSYLFIILNASQGVFIMLAFIINRRVFAMLKQTIHKDIDKPSTTAHKTTTTDITKSTDL